MDISRFSVNRPIFTIMVTLIVLLLGAVSLVRLPIDLMPDITYPAMSIRTEYTNAGPEEVEELVTRPIEEAVSAVPGVEEVSSNSSEGSSNVRVTLAWGIDMNEAANDIRERLDRIIPFLPDEADKPRLFKFDLAAFPVLILGVNSNLDPIQMYEIIDEKIKYRIERVPGVASLSMWGGLEREVHVNLFQDKIKAIGITVDQILARIKAGNVNFPAGSIEQGNYDIMVRTHGQYSSLEQLSETVVGIKDGVPVLLKEIAEVSDSWKKVRRIIRVNGKPGFRLAINKQSGTNTVKVAQAVLAEMEKIKKDFPQIDIIPIIDTSDYIVRSIRNLTIAAVTGGILAIFVLLFFLRNIKSTLVVATAIPTAIVATFALMYFTGFTLNIMTLGGLALGVGMLMDNAIVVLENIFRMHEAGEQRMNAAIEGSKEVTSPIIASTLTTVAVFMPLIFVRGMAGVMFKQLALVVSFALLCSLVAALTLVPTLSARLLSEFHEKKKSGSGILSLMERMFKGMEEGYKDLLHFSLNNRLLVGGLLLVIFAGSLFLVRFVGAELMPATDEGEVRVYAEMEVGTRLDVMDEKMLEIEAIVRELVPEIDNVVSSSGASHWSGGGGNNGRLRISLKPLAERTRSSEEIANFLRKKLSNIPGVSIRTRAGQGLFIMRRMTPTGEKINIEVRGYDLEKADVLAQRIKEVIRDVPGITDIRVSRESGAPERNMKINRERASDMKLTISQIADFLETVLSGSTASFYRTAGKEYRILVKLKGGEKIPLLDLLDLSLTNSEGERVVLRNVVDIEPKTGPVVIERTDRERVINLAVNISDRDMGSVIKDLRKQISTVPLGRDFTVEFSGDYEEQQKAFGELLLSFVLALVLVYMVMACQFESLRDPFVVMFSVPLAAIGVVLILLITDTTFNIQSFIGCIMLGGIVVNNAILLVDHTNLLRRRDGYTLRDAIEEAGKRRLRPILMTATTTILGLTPLAIGIGEGGEAQAPLARAVIGGLLSSSLITLVFVPIVYSVFEKKKKHNKEDNNAENEKTD